jgi:hypothetical protein
MDPNLSFLRDTHEVFRIMLIPWWCDVTNDRELGNFIISTLPLILRKWFRARRIGIVTHVWEVRNKCWILIEQLQRTAHVLESEGFWRWCITLRINGFMGYVHRPDRSTFRNFVFSSYLEFRTMNKIQKPGDSETTYIWLLMGSGIVKSIERNRKKTFKRNVICRLLEWYAWYLLKVCSTML